MEEIYTIDNNMSNEEKLAVCIVKKHLKVLSDQNKVQEIRKEYFELSIQHALITVECCQICKDESLSFWSKVRDYIIHISPHKLFDYI